MIPPAGAPKPVRYDGADLLESFLCCLLDAQALPANDPRSTQARLALASLDRHRGELPLAAPCSGADLECCIALCAQSAPAQFTDETSQHLWNTLKEALAEVEPMAAKRGVKWIPRSLDQIWTLLEAAELSEDSGAGEGAGSAAGGSARRL